MTKLTLGDLGLMPEKKDCEAVTIKHCGYCYSCAFNQAVDIINKITVEEVIERAINLGGLDYVHRDEICRFCECKLFHEEGCQCENDE